MRATSFTIVTAFCAVLISACGDNKVTPVDAQDTDAPKGGPQCSDGIDNDGDGKIDYPSDPGCLVPQQDDEIDDCPSGPNCPQCSNGVDDDGNGSTDYPNDPGCTSAADVFEFVNNPVACGAGLQIRQVPTNGTETVMLDATMSTSSIGSTCGGGGGAAGYAYQISLATAKVLVATTAGSTLTGGQPMDTVLDLRGTNCTGTEIECNDNEGALKTSKITRSLAPGNYYLIVQGKDSSIAGSYTIDIDLFTGEGESCQSTSQCGPGLVCRTPLGGTMGMICTQPQCSDNVDDDGDGKNDYPTDPGCDSAADNDEADTCPNGATCPACSNGIDDDSDTKIDYPMDTSCTSAAGNSEACTGEQDPITSIVAPTTSGTLIGAHDDHDPSCVTTNGEDVIYTLKLPAMRTLVLDTEGTAVDTVLSLLNSTCAEPSLFCDDEGGTSGNSSRITAGALAAGTYIVAVDNYNSPSTAPGPYDLHLSGVIAPGGACNPADTLGGALACPATNPCMGATGTMKCQLSACGDGTDNDADGKMDFPMDPGCTSLDDLDEADTCATGPGPGCPQCADGIDNDGDGQTDSADSNCTSPSVASEGCVSSEPVDQLVMPVTPGTTVGATNDISATCSATGTNTAPDRTYSLQIPSMRTLKIENSNSFDQHVKLLGSTCTGTPLQCSDEPETIQVSNLAGGMYFYVVDAFSSAAGAYTITVSGTIQNGASCESALALNGAITCGTGFSCRGTMGSRTCQAAACSDGVDNDSDGVADYPNDPGCTSISDSDESDNCPGGAGCPPCSDGLDNDGDGLFDYPNDPSCSAASGITESCTTSEGVTELVLPMTSDNTSAATNDTSPPTSCSSVNNAAPDKTYQLRLPGLQSLSITNANSFDAIVELLNGTCAGAPLACSDSPEDLSFTNLAAGTYFYVVDGYSTDPGGPFTVGISGKIAVGESCESPLALSGALTCASGTVCKGTAGARTCQRAACSDGMDNDNDTIADYPLDPGCSGPLDDDETNPTTATACANGMDDDADTTMDYPADYGCSSAGGTSEVFCTGEADPTSLIATTPITGTTAGLMNNFATQTCQSNSVGPDVAYALQLPVPVATLVLDLSTSGFDTVLSLRDTQCATEIGCNDDGGTPFGRSKLTVTDLAPGGYAVMIDGYDGTSGAYSLAIKGTVVSGTSCASPLFAAGVLACATGTTCNATTMVCSP